MMIKPRSKLGIERTSSNGKRGSVESLQLTSYIIVSRHFLHRNRGKTRVPALITSIQSSTGRSGYSNESRCDLGNVSLFISLLVEPNIVTLPREEEQPKHLIDPYPA